MSKDHHRDKEIRKIKWRSDFDKGVIINNFKIRKWTEGDEDDEGLFAACFCKL